MAKRLSAIVAALVALLVVGAWLWWPVPEDPEPAAGVRAAVVLTPPAAPIEPPAVVAEPATVEAAFRVLAEVEGAYVVRCPRSAAPLGKGPFVRPLAADGLALMPEPSGQGLAFAAPPRPGSGARLEALQKPSVLVRWGGAEEGVGWCVFEAVEEVMLAGVVRDEEGPVTPSWVTGCGIAMAEVDVDGVFEVWVPVGEPCQLQAEGRGDGVWVDPGADEGVLLVPWEPRVDGEREAVVDRLAKALAAMASLDAMEDPLELALERPELDPDAREVLEQMLAETQQEQAGRRAWVERALERYSGPQREVDASDEDRWPGLK